MDRKILLRMFALAAAMMCALGASAYDFYSGGLYYNITGSNTVEVTYSETNENTYSGYVKIPGSVTYNGTNYTVTAIGHAAFYYCYDLTEVSIPKTVTSIKHSAFSETGLTRIIIPNSVKEIGCYSFCNNFSLTDIIIGSGLSGANTIGAWAFSFCGEYSGDPPILPTQVVVCLTSRPPTLIDEEHEPDYVPDYNYLDVVFQTYGELYVPFGTGTFANTEGWNKFSNIQSESLYYCKSILNNGNYGTISFYNIGDYAWFINNTGGDSYAQSGNAGATSSTSTLTATINVQEDAILSFDFKAWGEGTSYDKCIFTVDDEQKFSYGARDNEWEHYAIELSAGSHIVTWSYEKDGSVDGTGDYFAIDHVAVWKKGIDAYACYTSSDSTMTFYYDNQRSYRMGTTYDLNTGNNNPGWYSDGTRSAVSRVVFDPSFAGARPTTAYRWFYWMTQLKSIAGMEYLNTSEVTNMAYMFYYCWNMTSLDLSSFNTSKVTTMSNMFRECFHLTSLDLSSFNTSNVTTMSYMFYNCTKLTGLNLSSFNTAKVTNMYYMFFHCNQLVTIYAGQGWNTNAVTSSENMFQLCSRLVGGKGTTYDASHLDKEYARIDGGTSNPGYLTDFIPDAYACYTPSNRTLTFYYDALRGTRTGTTYDLNEGINAPAPEWFSDGTRAYVNSVKFDPSFADARPTTTFRWFEEMRYLTSITGMEYLNTSEVTDMTNMFQQCEALNSLDVSHFNTSKVTTMYSMFCDCYSLMSLDLSHFKTENVTDMSFMFSGCTGLTSLDLSSFNVTGYVETYAMFGGCNSLTTIYASDSWNTVDAWGPYMFIDCTSLVGGKGTTYDADHVDQEYAHIDGGTSNPGYFTAKSSTLLGDVSGDGEIDVNDVTMMISCILNDTPVDLATADMNGDNVVDVLDVTLLIAFILNN